MAINDLARECMSPATMSLGFANSPSARHGFSITYAAPLAIHYHLMSTNPVSSL
jgi:hypothetical protein